MLYHPKHQIRLYIINSLIKAAKTMEMSSKIQAKRTEIRARHRREQLQNIFATKRKLMLQSLGGHYVQPPSDHFVYYYNQLKTHPDQVRSNLILMANFLAKDEPFLHYDQHGAAPSQSLLQQACLSLCEYVLLQIVLNCNTQGTESKKTRISCLTLVSNLVADPEVNNSCLVPTICYFLDQMYDSVEAHGFDSEIKEVGWMIGNLIGKNISSAPQKQLTYLLEWVEELLSVKDPDMLVIIYKNLPVLVASLQLPGLGPCQLPQIYKSSIINILMLCLTVGLQADLSTRLLPKSLSFLHSRIYIVLAYCPYDTTQLLISKLMKLLGTYSNQVLDQTFKVINSLIKVDIGKIVPHQRKVLEVIQKGKVYMVEQYVRKWLQLLQIGQGKLKLHLLTFMNNLLTSPCRPQHFAFIVTLLAETGLEEALLNIFKFQDQEVKIQCIHLAQTLRKTSQGKYGTEFFRKVQPYISAELEQYIEVQPGEQHPL